MPHVCHSHLALLRAPRRTPTSTSLNRSPYPITPGSSVSCRRGPELGSRHRCAQINSVGSDPCRRHFTADASRAKHCGYESLRCGPPAEFPDQEHSLQCPSKWLYIARMQQASSASYPPGPCYPSSSGRRWGHVDFGQSLLRPSRGFLNSATFDRHAVHLWSAPPLSNDLRSSSDPGWYLLEAAKLCSKQLGQWSLKPCMENTPSRRAASGANKYPKINCRLSLRCIACST